MRVRVDDFNDFSIRDVQGREMGMSMARST